MVMSEDDKRLDKTLERQDAQETRWAITRIKESLVTKNMSYRALKSQVDDPARVREVIARKQKLIDTMHCEVLHLEGILDSGATQCDGMLNTIYQLEDELRLLENKKSIDKLAKMFTHLVGTGKIAKGVNVEELMTLLDASDAGGSDE